MEGATRLAERTANLRRCAFNGPRGEEGEFREVEHFIHLSGEVQEEVGDGSEGGWEEDEVSLTLERRVEHYCCSSSLPPSSR